MAAGAPKATGKDAIQKEFAGMMGDPQFALTFSPTKIVVSKAGDMAYEIGDYQITFSGKKDKPVTTKAMYVVVWGKQADGSWKALLDTPGTTTD
jgi:ketosteroid isomerase-like protein